MFVISHETIIALVLIRNCGQSSCFTVSGVYTIIIIWITIVLDYVVKFHLCSYCCPVAEKEASMVPLLLYDRWIIHQLCHMWQEKFKWCHGHEFPVVLLIVSMVYRYDDDDDMIITIIIIVIIYDNCYCMTSIATINSRWKMVYFPWRSDRYWTQGFCIFINQYMYRPVCSWWKLE